MQRKNLTKAELATELRAIASKVHAATRAIEIGHPFRPTLKSAKWRLSDLALSLEMDSSSPTVPASYALRIFKERLDENLKSGPEDIEDALALVWCSYGEAEVLLGGGEQ